MAYMNPQQWRDNLIGRVTAFKDPNETEVAEELIPAVRQFQLRRGAPNYGLVIGSRGPTYDPIPIQQASTGTGLTSLQKGLEQFNQQQGGSVAGRSQVPPTSEQPSLYPSDRGQAAPGYGYGPSVPQGSDDPQGMMSQIGGFFNRPGAARDIGAALTSLGAGMGAESSRPGGSALAGFASGAEMATQSLARSREEEQRRQVIEEQRAAREEEKRIRDEDRARRIVAEDLATSQDLAKREAFAEMFPVDPETGEPGEFSIEGYDRVMRTVIKQGEVDLYGTLMQMRPEDPEEIPLGDWKEANGARRDESGAWRKVFYRTGADGTVETQLSEYTVEPPAGARAGGAGGQFQKEEALGLVSLAAINSLVDTGGWMSLAGWVRDDDAFDELQGQILLDNPDATAVQIMEATLPAWSKAEGFMPEGSWFDEDGELQLGDEAAMMINMVLSDPSGSSEEGDWAITKFLKAKGREWAQNNAAGAAYATATAHALQAINPLVRYLSGAQMTNREAMRYYGAVIPSWGDSEQTVNAKMRGLSLLARAMGGDIEAMERVDMSGFVDDPNLTPQKNIEARGEWAKAQLTRIVMEEESSASREANVEAARTRQEEALALFDADGIPINPSAFPITDPFATGAATDEFSMFRSGYTPTAEERARAGMTSAGVATDTTAPVDYDAMLQTDYAQRTIPDRTARIDLARLLEEAGISRSGANTWIRSYGANPQRARGLLMQQIGPGP